MTDKTELQKPIERETGLSVERMETRERLNALLNAGLAKLYCEVFAEPPWGEKFSNEEAREIFRDYFEDKGDIFIVTDPQKQDKPVAFAVTIPLAAADWKIQEQVQFYRSYKRAKDCDIAYFADGGVDPAYRRRGLSTSLKKLRLEACKAKGIERAILRTNEGNYAEINVVNKTGGTVLSGLYNMVASKRVNGKVSRDTRQFYVYDLQAKDEPDVLQCVKIVTEGMYDTVIISDAVPPQERDSLNWRISKIYPKVNLLKGVIFKEKTIFEGNIQIENKIAKVEIIKAGKIGKVEIYDNEIRAIITYPGKFKNWYTARCEAVDKIGEMFPEFRSRVRFDNIITSEGNVYEGRLYVAKKWFKKAQLITGRPD